MSDDMAKALGMTAADAAHDADCEHFRQAAMLAARVMQAEERADQLEAFVRTIVDASEFVFTDATLYEWVVELHADAKALLDPSGDDAA